MGREVRVARVVLGPFRALGYWKLGAWGNLRLRGTGSCGARVAREARVARVVLGHFRA